jgi:hypothetical protein
LQEQATSELTFQVANDAIETLGAAFLSNLRYTLERERRFISTVRTSMDEEEIREPGPGKPRHYREANVFDAVAGQAPRQGLILIISTLTCPSRSRGEHWRWAC